MSLIKNELKKKGYPIVALAKAAGIHPSRVSLFLNLWLKPNQNDINRLHKGLERLQINPYLAEELSNQFEASLKLG